MSKFGGGSASNSAAVAAQQAAAAEARAREAERKRRINEGLGRIETAFADFTDPFYNTYRTANLDYLNPQLEDQYEDARRELTFRLARAGQLNSQVAADELADLERQYTERGAEITNRADQAVGALKDRVAATRDTLTSQLYSTEDPETTGSQALSRAATLRATEPTLEPLGQLFQVAAIGLGNYLRGQEYGDLYRAASGPSLIGQRRESGRKVVR